MYTCKNYRPMHPVEGCVHNSDGRILADLYDEDGKFYRSAVVADVGVSCSCQARKYANDRNEELTKAAVVV